MTTAPLRHVRHVSESSNWEMAIRPATRALQPFVKNYTWYIDRASRISRRMQVPHSGIVLIIALGTKMRVVDPRVEATHSMLLGTYVAGLFGGPVFTEYCGTSEGIQVDLTPLGAQRLLGVPMDTLTGRVIEVSEIMGVVAKRLEEQLLDTPGCAERIDLVESFILQRLAASDPAPAAIEWVWQQLHASHGNSRIGDLVSATGLTHKQLIARFREYVGVAPAMVSRLVRFERAVGAVTRGESASLADIAMNAGYYDQAHFNREFRAFTGITPSAYATRLLPEGGGVSGMD